MSFHQKEQSTSYRKHKRPSLHIFWGGFNGSSFFQLVNGMQMPFSGKSWKTASFFGWSSSWQEECGRFWERLVLASFGVLWWVGEIPLTKSSNINSSYLPLFNLRERQLSFCSSAIVTTAPAQINCLTESISLPVLIYVFSVRAHKIALNRQGSFTGTNLSAQS